MPNLIAPESRVYRGSTHVTSLPGPSSAATTLWRGSAVQEGTGGLAENLTGAGTTFSGFLDESITGDGTTNDNNRVRIIDEGEVLLEVASASTLSRADVGATVYASDGNTFTLVSTNNQAIGKVTEVPAGVHGLASGKIFVAFKGKHRQVG